MNAYGVAFYLLLVGAAMAYFGFDVGARMGYERGFEEGLGWYKVEFVAGCFEIDDSFVWGGPGADVNAVDVVNRTAFNPTVPLAPAGVLG